VLDQRHAGVGDLAQVVAGDLGGQAHGNAAGAVEQRKRQAGRQLAGLFGGAVVVGMKSTVPSSISSSSRLVMLGQPRLGVAHGRGAVAVAAAEVALAVDQRVALREVLRHAHQRVVGRLVAVRVEAAQHVAHHARDLTGLAPVLPLGPPKPRPMRDMAVQDAALHRLLAVAHIGQARPLTTLSAYSR
jgi:hypothetical protein